MQRLTLVVTNLIKVGGLATAVHSAFSTHPSAVVLGLSGFMMAGAQLSETTLLSLAERFFGIHHASEEEPPK